MLDDLKMIHERDAQDALGIAEKQGEQLLYGFEVQPPLEPTEADNIVVAGMGGSALAALIASSWPGFDRPFEITRGYEIPSYVGQRTVFLASSYSGNTEETVSATEAAENQGAKTVVIASGGRLSEMAQEKGRPLLTLPSGLQPRHATFYSLKALLTATDGLGITRNTAEELAGKADFVHEASQSWLPTVPTKSNLAKQLALEMIGKSVAIYAGPKLWPAAYKWRISLNENAKHIAWANQFPEFNHNELMGWTKQPVDKPYTVVEIRSDLEHPRVQKRFEITEQVLSGMRPSPIVIKPQGEDLIEQMLSTIVLGDFVSLYTAILNGINPTPVEQLERFKKLMVE